MSSLEEEIKQLRTEEREQADRKYNDALTALDGTVQCVPSDMPHPPPSLDEHQITPLNQLWNILAETPSMGTGWRGRVRTFIWELVSPFFSRQQDFNSAVVDHINRNVPVQRETRKAIESTIGELRAQLEALVSFESHLILYVQQITLYVDTKDRFCEADLRADIRMVEGYLRRAEADLRGLNADLVSDLFRQVRLFGTALGGVSDEIQIRWESMVARERRYEARTAALTTAHEELRTSVGMVQQAAMTLKREIERLMSVVDAREGEPLGTASMAVTASVNTAVSGSDIGSYKYVGFEDKYRGSQEVIGQRLTDYMTLFAGASDVLDVGCGRGEFLDLLRQHNVTARGLDINHEMVEMCRARGLDVTEADALGYLRAAPDESLGGLFAAQVVEHLQPDYLLQMLETAYFKLRPGAKIVLETINPACWFAYFESYIRDITHVRALHPDTLNYLLLANGFQRVEIRYSAPYPEERKLRPLPGEGDLSETFNANVEKLNQLLFTHLDYAAIAEKL